MILSENIEVNIKKIETLLEGCADVVHRKMIIANVTAYVIYMDSMIDRELIEGEFLLPPPRALLALSA